MHYGPALLTKSLVISFKIKISIHTHKIVIEKGEITNRSAKQQLDTNANADLRLICFNISHLMTASFLKHLVVLPFYPVVSHSNFFFGGDAHSQHKKVWWAKKWHKKVNAQWNSMGIWWTGARCTIYQRRHQILTSRKGHRPCRLKNATNHDEQKRVLNYFRLIKLRTVSEILGDAWVVPGYYYAMPLSLSYALNNNHSIFKWPTNKARCTLLFASS